MQLGMAVRETYVENEITQSRPPSDMPSQTKMFVGQRNAYDIIKHDNKEERGQGTNQFYAGLRRLSDIADAHQNINRITTRNKNHKSVDLSPFRHQFLAIGECRRR